MEKILIALCIFIIIIVIMVLIKREPPVQTVIDEPFITMNREPTYYSQNCNRVYNPVTIFEP